MFFSKKLQEEIKIINERIAQQHPQHSTETKRLLQFAKLTEEVGELSNEILASVGYQRKEKLKNHSKQTLESEFADVFITSLLLAQTCEIDINKALEEKFKKLDNRWK